MYVMIEASQKYTPCISSSKRNVSVASISTFLQAAFLLTVICPAAAATGAPSPRGETVLGDAGTRHAGRGTPSGHTR